jgi:hypothetical protein|tara:strand:+ start:159 stop:392 length:234 start_codon:yes stop_codon:yes gene_type:complete
MRGNEKQKWLNDLTFDLDVVQYQTCIGNYTEKELLKEHIRLKRLIKKNTLFIRKIKEMLEQQVFFIEKQLWWIGVEL